MVKEAMHFVQSEANAYSSGIQVYGTLMAAGWHADGHHRG